MLSDVFIVVVGAENSLELKSQAPLPPSPLEHHLFVAGVFPFAYGLVPFRDIGKRYAAMVDLHFLMEDDGVPLP